MSLRDLACYTLTVKPHTSDLNVTELVAVENGKEEHRFARVREQKEGEAYSAAIYDALSGAKLASVGFVSDKQKNRRLQLHNPDESVAFDNTSKLGFEWTFVFEGNKYRWTKEVYGKDYICSLDRKPDPKVEICLARDSDSKGPGRLQILHYNIDRFPDDIKDLRGLETLLVASLMCFVDSAQDRANSSRSKTPVAGPSSIPVVAAGPAIPMPPPKVITPDDFEDDLDPNEILVGTNTDVGEHIARAVGLLEDPDMLFIVIRTKTAAASQRALEVSLGVTRFRHREGMGDLHQYVIEEDPVREKPTTTVPTRQGRRVINLDDRPAPLPPTKPKWSGPPNIAIYLSSIELPDLKPKPKVGPNAPPAIQQAPPVPSAQARPPPSRNMLEAVPPRSDRPREAMSPSKNKPSAQKSISSFFKRKSPPQSSPSRVNANGNGNGNKHAIEVIDDDEPIDVTGSPPVKKSKTSSYFGAAKAGPSTEKGEPKIEPSIAPAHLQAYRLPRSNPVLRSQTGSAFDAFTYASQTQPGASQPRTPAQQAKHEEWHRRVVGGTLIPRRRSLALDEAAALEARRQLGLGDDDDDNDKEDILQTPAEDGGESDQERQKAAEKLGETLAAKYGAKADAKGKGKAKATSRKKKVEEVGPSGQTYTPLEKQYLEHKAQNPDVLLMMEVGYKFKFHGEDAKIASRELGIAAFPARNFYTASIPTHRLLIHVKKLISLGHKVGVITQTETAALKKIGENRNAPFTRKLTQLYTAATYVNDSSLGASSTLSDDPILPGTAAPPTNAIMAIVEKPLGGQAVDERARIAIVSVIPETGEVIWDEFDDSAVRSELETRLTHLQPRELLLPAEGLSAATEKLLKHFAGQSKS